MSRERALTAIRAMRDAQADGDLSLAACYAQIYMAEQMAADYASDKGWTFNNDQESVAST